VRDAFVGLREEGELDAAGTKEVGPVESVQW